jgi:ATP-dependent DNA helicase RecG
MLLTEEAQLKLSDMTQALAVERRHRFIDVQGRRMPFSRFMTDSLRQLSRYILDPDGIGALIPRFERYHAMDVSARMTALDGLEQWMRSLQQGPKPVLVNAPLPGSSAANSIDIQDPFETDVRFIKGVGPKLATQLKLLGLSTVAQLLRYYPRDYIDYAQQLPIAHLLEGQFVSIVAKVQGVNHFEPKGRGLTIVRLKMADATGFATASWFFSQKQTAMMHAFKGKFTAGAEVLLSGKVKWDNYTRCPSIDRAEVQLLSYEEGDDPGSSLHSGRIVPVYALTQGLGVKTLRRAIHQGLTDFIDQWTDPLPAKVRQQFQLLPFERALMGIHFPETLEQAKEARRRLAFDEFFMMQLRLGLMRAQYKRSITGLRLAKTPGGLVDQLLASLPFSLTGAQRRVVGEVETDLASAEPMNRLLHGDVGSGKTVVAALALLVALENGYQGALMAPTEILAEQHFRKFVDWLTPLGIRVGVVLGKANAKQRREVRQGLLNGQIQLAVGTHALIQDDVEFANLGVIVVDEQHRFGVRQRMRLREKGQMPELLTMTATPIPRTLALTLHGDLDVSLLDELPPGRSPIKTVLLSGAQSDQGMELIRQQVALGRQAYVVFPLIDESETLSAKAATTEAARLAAEVFPELKVGLLHGKMKPEEKDAVMHQFSQGHVQVLVATTVVEVGVDVPNATVMVIDSADRFGLAQLHQLRGRVGRGAHQSYCVLVASKLTPETRERLTVLVDSTNGFEIAERDLAFRGPGDYLGTRQSGLPDLMLGDLVKDRELLEQAREAAMGLLAEDPDLLHHPQLLRELTHQDKETSNLIVSG